MNTGSQGCDTERKPPNHTRSQNLLPVDERSKLPYKYSSHLWALQTEEEWTLGIRYSSSPNHVDEAPGLDDEWPRLIPNPLAMIIDDPSNLERSSSPSQDQGPAAGASDKESSLQEEFMHHAEAAFGWQEGNHARVEEEMEQLLDAEDIQQVNLREIKNNE